MQHAIDHLSAADPVLAAVIDMVGPYTFTPGSHGFRTLVDAIVSQQISVKAAAAIMGRLEALLGETTPARVLEVTPEELRAVGISGQKARYLRDLAERATLGVLDLSALPSLDDDTVIAQLTAVKGIGRWTAEIYLLFALGRPDILPAEDLGLRVAAQQFYDLPEPPKPAELRRMGEAWRPYRSVASWYLWRGRHML
ncbi:MAG: DNA-3-methyladenine glycosylase 2 family protein [Oscillochloris sp.]|nr:DNA-3-methyladenine glycosylase 2 family protein [Oscillochloris sp.]